MANFVFTSSTTIVLDATTGAGTDFEVTVPEDASYSWMIDQNSTRTAEQVVTGGGQDSGVEYLLTGTHLMIYDMTGATTGTYYVHMVKTSGSAVASASFSFTEPA